MQVALEGRHLRAEDCFVGRTRAREGVRDGACLRDGQLDRSFTAAFDLSGLPSDVTSWKWKGKIEDNDRTKSQVTVTITVD